jgi:hypothetical protein
VSYIRGSFNVTDLTTKGDSLATILASSLPSPEPEYQEQASKGKNKQQIPDTVPKVSAPVGQLQRTFDVKEQERKHRIDGNWLPVDNSIGICFTEQYNQEEEL